jgi:hypothetical protein
MQATYPQPIEPDPARLEGRLEQPSSPRPSLKRRVVHALKEHFVHHRRYVVGCLGGALLAIIGGLLDVPILEVTGAVICSGFCLQMIRMTAFKPRHR